MPTLPLIYRPSSRYKKYILSNILVKITQYPILKHRFTLVVNETSGPALRPLSVGGRMCIRLEPASRNPLLEVGCV